MTPTIVVLPASVPPANVSDRVYGPFTEPGLVADHLKAHPGSYAVALTPNAASVEGIIMQRDALAFALRDLKNNIDVSLIRTSLRSLTRWNELITKAERALALAAMPPERSLFYPTTEESR